MNLIETGISGVYIIEPKVFGDERGWFMESWSQRAMEQAGQNFRFVQDNHSFSKQANTLRGIHFQQGGSSQAKLVRCTKGAVLDVAVDLRKDSETYLKWIKVELSAENKRQLLIPRGCGHAFLTLTDDTEFMYKSDNFYDPKADRSVIWNDPTLAISWPTKHPILSEKDKNAPTFKETEHIL